MMELGLIFDLDGVVVNTAKYHYLAWRAIANELGIPFSEQDNELLKGVSRGESFRILLGLGGVEMSADEQAAYCYRKDELYRSYLQELTSGDLLPGVRSFIQDARSHGCRVALGSASRNSMLVLQKLEAVDLFDAIIDGNAVAAAKPDPEVFLKGAQALSLAPAACIVFEDAAAGIVAAQRAGMRTVGIGDPDCLPGANLYWSSFAGQNALALAAQLKMPPKVGR